MTLPTELKLARYEDWERRLHDLAAEMEEHFGEPGQNNQDPLDSAVHVAAYVASKETAFLRSRGAQRIAP